MTIKQTLKENIARTTKKLYNLADFEFQIEYPPKSDMGDYSCNVAMLLTKKLKKNPLEIGQEIVEALKKEKNLSSMVAKIDVVKPGFINFFLSESLLNDKVTEILKQKEKFGSNNVGKNKTVIVEYSSPNVAKNMHAGHLRSTIIGDSLARIYEFLNYKVISDNHLGDWGTQYGILIYEYKNKYGTNKKEGLTIDELEMMYVDFMNKEKDNPDIRKLAKDEHKKLQNGDKINHNLWQYFYKISLDEFKKTYEKLDIRPFDLWLGESFYHEMLDGIVTDALKKKIAQKSDGAIIVPLDKFDLPPGMIKKSDETFLYLTTDLATVKYRHEKYKPYKCLYIVANQQTLHFEQIFGANKLLKLSGNEELIHIKFGMLLDESGKKMSTRKGGVVKLSELIDQIIEKAKEVVKEKNSELTAEESKEIANAVGIGALKFNDLSQNRLSDILFDWEKMLSFESGSAPYLQYTYVRIMSLLGKAEVKPKAKQFENLIEKEEILLIKNLIKFEEIVIQAAEENKPNIIANYLTSLSSNFHRFYEKIPIVKSEKEIQKERLGLVLAVAQVIKNGLDLLGIKVVSKM